jgi:hypothetical protein
MYMGHMKKVNLKISGRSIKGWIYWDCALRGVLLCGVVGGAQTRRAVAERGARAQKQRFFDDRCLSVGS